MKTLVHAVFACVFCCARLIAQHSDSYFIGLLKDIETNYLGKERTELEKRFGTLISIDGTSSSGTMYYSFALTPKDVTRVTGFSLKMSASRVQAVRPIISDIPFFGIGTLPGFAGPDATQSEIIECFEINKGIKEIPANIRIDILKTILSRIEIAKDKKEKFTISKKCEFFLLLRIILSSENPKLNFDFDSKTEILDMEFIENNIKEVISKKK